jgi:hypothetical protein
MKHLEHTVATYVYSHYNICNIEMKNVQYLDETVIDETLATYV